MKKFLYTFLLVSFAALGFAACDDEDNGVDTKNYGPISVSKVYQHSAKVIKELDPEVGARLGTNLRLEGKNFKGIKKIVVNGSPAYINPNMLTETSIIFRIPSYDANNAETPTGDDCADEYRDKIIISSNGNEDYVFPFRVMGSAPSITSVSHTLPNEGSWVTVKGSSLKGVSKVEFYNDNDELVAETEAIRNEDAKGKVFQFQTPAFPDTYNGGYIMAKTDNGDAVSANYFWRVKNIFLSKFYSEEDDGLYKKNPQATNTSYYAWGSGTSGNMPDAEAYPDIPEVFPAEGDGPKNPAIFRSMPDYPGAKVSVLALSDGEHSADGGACIARACFNSDACSGRALGMAEAGYLGINNDLFTTATPCEQIAFQFDYFIPGPWDSGRIAVTFVDAGIKWMANFHPWTKDPDAYKNGMTEWQTATIPLSDFPNFAGQTYGFVLKNTIKGTNGDYACQGMIAFYNDDCDGIAAHEYENFIMYWNNLRVVPYVTKELEEDEE